MSKQRAQSSTLYPMNFLMVLTSDHITGATGLTVAVTLSKNGAAFGAAAGAVTEIGSGWYSLAGNATDRATLGELLIHATSATADPTDEKYEIITVDAFAAQFPANVTQWNGANVVAPNVAGVPVIDAEYWDGTAIPVAATLGIPDINVKNINNAAATTPGASGGLLINGTNSGALTESYAAVNVAPTFNQLLFELRAILAENGVSGTTVTTKKIDGSTTAHTYTTNSATVPTNITTAS